MDFFLHFFVVTGGFLWGFVFLFDGFLRNIFGKKDTLVFSKLLKKTSEKTKRFSKDGGWL